MSELIPANGSPPRKWTAKRIAISVLKFYGACLVMVSGISLSFWLIYLVAVRIHPQGSAASSSTSAADGSRLPEVGSTTFIGRTNCDRAVKAILRDPGSYERISAQIVDVKPGAGWAAQVDFRSRNGFGGYDQGTAYCVFNGSEYRALMEE
jgi:hypothetical protein